MEPFEYRHDGEVFRGQLALPGEPGPHPGVLVMHDGRGVGDFVCGRARALAELGYVALAADLYGQGRVFDDPAEGSAAAIDLRERGEVLRGRVVASFEAFRSLSEVEDDRIGAIGYCLGGQCVLELARSGADARAVVSFHGALTTHERAAPGRVRARVLVLTGARDPYAPPEHRAALQRELDDAGADWQMTVYGSGKHGFTDPIADEAAATVPGVGYSRELDRLSWAQAMRFLDWSLQ